MTSSSIVEISSSPPFSYLNGKQQKVTLVMRTTNTAEMTDQNMAYTTANMIASATVIPRTVGMPAIEMTATTTARPIAYTSMQTKMGSQIIWIRNLTRLPRARMSTHDKKIAEAMKIASSTSKFVRAGKPMNIGNANIDNVNIIW